MKLIKRLFTRTIAGEEKVMPTYFIVTDEGKQVAVKPVFPNEWNVLNFLSEFVPNESSTKKNRKD